MRISNLRIRHAPDMVLGDLHFDVGAGLDQTHSRVDRLFDAFADGLDQLDRGGVFTHSDSKSEAYVCVERQGSEVLVQSNGNAYVPDGSTKLGYPEFRAYVVGALLEYRDKLAEKWPTHPETVRVRSRLETPLAVAANGDSVIGPLSPA